MSIRTTALTLAATATVALGTALAAAGAAAGAATAQSSSMGPIWAVNFGDNSARFVDERSLSINGDVRSIMEMGTFKNGHNFAGTTIHAYVTTTQVNCRTRQTRLLNVVGYNRAFEVVVPYNTASSDWDTVSPNTAGADMVNFICSERSRWDAELNLPACAPDFRSVATFYFQYMTQ
ncbi:MAG: surface-adhesin E family protein [Brevundimonas sp.]|uniref:surface-adhesin E family protein n=1 Tax=Brevundimonas sp. TaxID=1871086 RepID=UPI00391950C4